MTGPTADQRDADLEASYDRVAGVYAARLHDELRHKPLDCLLLDRFAESVRPIGPACDLGCGPGQVAGYLHGRGLAVVGVDLSSAMLEQARRRHPEIEFRRGDLRALEVEDAAWGGIAAFYSLIHIPPAEHGAVFRELARVLRPGGVLLAAFHVGDETIHLDEWLGNPVSVDFHFLRPDRVAAGLEAAGFAIVDVVEREPYPGVEHPSRRAYVEARKPPGTPAPPAFPAHHPA